MTDYTLNNKIPLTSTQNEIKNKYKLNYELILSRVPQLKQSSINTLIALNNLSHSKVISYDFHNRLVTLKCNLHGVIYTNRPERILDHSKCPLCISITISENTKQAMNRPEVKIKVDSENKSIQHKERFNINKHHGSTKVPTSTEALIMKFMLFNGFIWNQQTNTSTGYYKSDFMHTKSKLIIELDGSYHNTKEQQEKDLEKDTFFKSLGFTTYRFDNKYIVTHRKFFEEIIINYLNGGDDLYDRLYTNYKLHTK